MTGNTGVIMPLVWDTRNFIDEFEFVKILSGCRLPREKDELIEKLAAVNLEIVGPSH